MFDPSALIYIDFYSDPDGSEFPKLSNFWLEQSKEFRKGNLRNFLDLDLYGIDSEFLMYDAKLDQFNWMTSTKSAPDVLTLEFRLRNRTSKLTLRYVDPTFVGSEKFDPACQSLYLQALGVSGNRFRHEFFFHNRSMIIESRDFNFQIS